MTVTLAVETSSVHVGVAMVDGADVLAHRTQRRDSPSYPGLARFAIEVLDMAVAVPADVRRLAVNVGPGNLGSVRSGVAYANGLAFSLGVPVASVDSLTLLASEVFGSPGASAGEPVLCVRNAGSGNVFAGLFLPAHAVAAPRFGPLAEVVRELAGGLCSVISAGSLRDQVAAVLTSTQVKDSGVDYSNVLTLGAVVASGAAAEDHVATPITDASMIFNG